MSLVMGSVLRNRANLHPNLEAVVGPTARFTYREFNHRVNQLAHYLRDQNVKKGDRVAILCHTDHPFITILWAALKIGAIAVPLNYRLHGEELKWIVGHSRPTAIFYDGDFSSAVSTMDDIESLKERAQVTFNDQLHPDFSSIFDTYPTEEPEIELDGEDPAILTYTSGTTGKPKGVISTHTNLYHPGPAAFLHVGIHTGDRVLLPTPLFHISGIVMVTNAPWAGTTTVCMPKFHPDQILDLVEKERINQMVGIGPMLQMILGAIMKDDRELETLRLIISGGASVPIPLMKQYHSLGFPIMQIYGLSEYTSVATFWHPDLMGMDTCGSVGKNMVGEVKVVDPDTGRELPRGEVGEVLIRGPQLFQGYWNNPEATARALREGWFHTEDAGKVDKKGCLHIVGRFKDVIHVSSEKVFPAEVEDVISELDDVLEVAVIPIKDTFWGELPRACVVKQPGSPLQEEDILRHTHRKLAKHKLAEVVITDTLPKNGIGKVLKNVLCQQAEKEMKNRTP